MADPRNQSAGLGPAVAALGLEPVVGGLAGAPSTSSGRRQKRLPGGRHRQVKVRCSDEELAVLEGLAEGAGVSIPKLLLDGILVRDGLTSVRRQGRYATFMAARRVLAGVATNLNQVARWSNTEHQLAPGFDATLEEVASAVGALDRAIEDLLK